MNSAGSRQQAHGGSRKADKVMPRHAPQALPRPRGRRRVLRRLLPTACCLLLTTFNAGCAVDERRDVPAGAQATIERVTEDIAAGRDAKVYEEAAEEWRTSVTPEENARLLSRVRENLGRVESRALHQGREQQSAAAPLSGHALELVYRTRFERASATEKFTLLERGGEWLLAGYSVSSDALGK